MSKSQPARPIFNTVAAREKLGDMPVAELARRMGLTRQAVGHWFRQRGEPDMVQLKAMAKVLGCHWLELVNEDATVIQDEAEAERVKSIRELPADALAELDAFLAFKRSQAR